MQTPWQKNLEFKLKNFLENVARDQKKCALWTKFSWHLLFLHSLKKVAWTTQLLSALQQFDLITLLLLISFAVSKLPIKKTLHQYSSSIPKNRKP